MRMKPISMLPNLLTLGNAGCGLLAVCKAIDALAYSGEDPDLFYRKMEVACGLVFLAMVFDALDGRVARLTQSFSDFGGQLDSLADALTFGVAPALLAKVLIEHEGALFGFPATPRIGFAAAACYALLTLLRLARFNLETDHEPEAHEEFRGLPSPAAAGAVAATIGLFLALRRPELEHDEGTPTPLGRLMGWMHDVDWSPLLAWVPAFLLLLLPLLGILMVSRVRYPHIVSVLLRERSTFFTLVTVVFAATLLYLAPVLFLFLGIYAFVLYGPVHEWVGSLRRARAEAARAEEGR